MIRSMWRTLVVLSLLATAVTFSDVRPAAAMAVLHVDVDATGAADGSSWVDAFTTVSDAITIASPGDQIWVSEGTYGETNTISTTNISILGGFDGSANPSMGDRDPSSHVVRIESTVPGGSVDTLRVLANDFTLDGVVIGGTGVGIRLLAEDMVMVAVSIVPDSGGLLAGGELVAGPIPSSLHATDSTISSSGAGVGLQVGKGADITLVDSAVSGTTNDAIRIVGDTASPGILGLTDSTVSASQSSCIDARGILSTKNVEIFGCDIGLQIIGEVLPVGTVSPIVELDATTISANTTGVLAHSGLGAFDVTMVNSVLSGNIGAEIETVENPTYPGSVFDVINSTIVGIDGITGLIDPIGAVHIKNSIVDLGSAGLHPDALSTFEDSIVRDSGGSGSWSFGMTTDLGDNTDADPVFAPGPGFHLESWSPAVNAADPTHLPTSGFTEDIDGDPRIRDSVPDQGADETEAPPRMVVLPAPCVLYDSQTATTPILAGPLDGGEVRTLRTRGPLVSLQGGDAGCLPLHDTAGIVVTVSALDPVGFGNLRLSTAGVVPNGGIVNYTSNGLNNTNTVTVIPDDAIGARVDIAANGNIGVPSTDVRIVAVGYYIPSEQTPGAGVVPMEYVPVTPCAVVDTRFASAPWLGPHPTGTTLAAIDVGGTLDPAQGGETDCNIPDTADALVANLVAIQSTGEGRLSIGPTPGPPPNQTAVAFADLGMNNSASVVLPLGASPEVLIRVAGATGATSHVRLVVLGYLESGTSGDRYLPLSPCAAFDTRSAQGATGSFAGPRAGGSTTTFQITGALDPAQGGLNNGGCGIPDNATAVLINLVAVAPQGFGNLRISAAGVVAPGGVLNFAPLSPAMNNSNAVPVGLSATGAVDVFANSSSPGSPATEVRGVVVGYFV